MICWSWVFFQDQKTSGSLLCLPFHFCVSDWTERRIKSKKFVTTQRQNSCCPLSSCSRHTLSVSSFLLVQSEVLDMRAVFTGDKKSKMPKSSPGSNDCRWNLPSRWPVILVWNAWETVMCAKLDIILATVGQINTDGEETTHDFEHTNSSVVQGFILCWALACQKNTCLKASSFLGNHICSDFCANSGGKQHNFSHFIHEQMWT